MTTNEDLIREVREAFQHISEVQEKLRKVLESGGPKAVDLPPQRDYTDIQLSDVHKNFQRFFKDGVIRRFTNEQCLEYAKIRQKLYEDQEDMQGRKAWNQMRTQYDPQPQLYTRMAVAVQGKDGKKVARGIAIPLEYCGWMTGAQAGLARTNWKWVAEEAEANPGLAETEEEEGPF